MIALAAFIAQSAPVEDFVDVIEINHIYDRNGRHTYCQMIAWEWQGEHLRVVDWRCWRSNIRPQDHGPFVRLVWNDGIILRKLYAVAWVETHTQHDPELDDRREWSVERRRKFSKE